MEVTSGLVIREPWIGLILSGEKTWEMRSTAAAFRGWFGLIRKGSGTVVGVARLVKVGARLSDEEMIATVDKHRISEAMIRSGQVGRWTVPWVIAGARALARPVPYEHRAGAVTWVRLDAAVSDAIAAQSVERMESRSVAEAKSGMWFEVELTQGNIDHGHIYLRSQIDRFPDDLIGGSNGAATAPRTAVVDWGGPAPAQTDIDGAKKFFRRRAWVGAFLTANDAAPGDRVRVEETGPYRYRVSLRRKGAL